MTRRNDDMASLLDNIIALEQEADGLIEAAHTQSRTTLASVDDELSRYRGQLAAELEARLAEFKADVEKRFEESLARASGQHAERLQAIKELPEEFSTREVSRILDRFNNW
jgi:hypothetical protein